jgi:hypothetical protein
MFLTSGATSLSGVRQSGHEEPEPLLAAVLPFYEGGADSLVRAL